MQQAIKTTGYVRFQAFKRARMNEDESLLGYGAV
jgi:hypothetical protein